MANSRGEHLSAPPGREPVLARAGRALASLRARLIVPYVLLTLLTAVIGVYVVTRLVAASTRERFVNRMVEAGRVAADGVVRHERSLLESMRLLAFLEGGPQALAQGEASTLAGLMQPVVVNNGLPLVAVIGRDGREVVSFVQGEVTLTGSDFAGLEPVARVLRSETDVQGDKFAGLWQSPAGWYLILTAPVSDTNGQLQGALLAGTPLIALAAELKEQSLADILVLSPDGDVAGSTLAEPDEGFGALTLEAPLTAGATLQRSVRLYGRDYELVYAPLEARGQAIGALAVALPSGYITSAESTSRDVFSLVFALGTGTIIVAGYGLAQSIARPILRLRNISQAVAAGDLDQRSGLSMGDEIGELAGAFDSMTGKLRERTQEARRLYAESISRNRELEETNRRLKSTQQQLIQSEKMAAIGLLTAGIVHDVKNPLTIIRGVAEVLESDPQVTPEIQHHLRNVAESARRADRIISDLLKFSRQSTPEMSSGDLRETVQAAARLNNYLARQAHVKIKLHVPDVPVRRMFDPQQIEQVLVNLVQNAIQAMPGGGELELRLELADGKSIIVVRDTGAGIPPDVQLRIFDPFFTTKPEGEGTGLGLSVSYGIVARHGGLIRVESQVGQGATFFVELPDEAPGPDGDQADERLDAVASVIAMESAAPAGEKPSPAPVEAPEAPEAPAGGQSE